VFFWFVLGAVMTGAILAWSVHIPTYVGGTGLIAQPDGGSASSARTSNAVLFLAPDQSSRVRAGRPVHLLLGGEDSSVQGVIEGVRPGVIGPAAARRRYGASGLVSQPSIVVVVRLSRPLPARVYAGSHVTARVELASERILSLLTG
jgi:hypothetical protein